MKVLDPGHRYLLTHLDGSGEQELTFVKRIGEGYPGNTPPAHEGTTIQEVLRVLIDRLKYVDHQSPAYEDLDAIGCLRLALLHLENRAARVRGHSFEMYRPPAVELEPTCPVCGHIVCRATH